MGKPHKHSELIKLWADGAEIEYRIYSVDSWTDWKDCVEPTWITDWDFEYRLKQEIPQWHKDIIQAIKEGKEIQVFRNGEWVKSNLEIISWENPSYFGYYKESEYRIKPEPKPDFMEAIWSGKNECWVEILWDGETGELKSAEVIK